MQAAIMQAASWGGGGPAAALRAGEHAQVGRSAHGDSSLMYAATNRQNAGSSISRGQDKENTASVDQGTVPLESRPMIISSRSLLDFDARGMSC
jgi:hypothetical protein